MINDCIILVKNNILSFQISNFMKFLAYTIFIALLTQFYRNRWMKDNFWDAMYQKVFQLLHYVSKTMRFFCLNFLSFPKNIDFHNNDPKCIKSICFLNTLNEWGETKNKLSNTYQDLLLTTVISNKQRVAFSMIKI